MNMPTEQAAMMQAEAQAQSQETQAPYDKSDLTLRDRLIEAGILLDTGEDGIYGRSAAFEDVLERLSVAVTLLGADQNAEVLRFPPALRRRDFEAVGR